MTSIRTTYTESHQLICKQNKLVNYLYSNKIFKVHTFETNNVNSHILHLSEHHMVEQELVTYEVPASAEGRSMYFCLDRSIFQPNWYIRTPSGEGDGN
jgi:hypothetical protein